MVTGDLQRRIDTGGAPAGPPGPTPIDGRSRSEVASSNTVLRPTKILLFMYKGYQSR